MAALVKLKPAEDEYSIKPENIKPTIDTSHWPLLLRNYSNCMQSLSKYLQTFLTFLAVLVRTGHFTPIPAGCSPLKRDLKSYISSGVINLDKPSNPSSHEVVAWVKRMLR